MRENPSQGFQVGFVGPVIHLPVNVGGAIFQQLPSFSLVGIGRTGGVPLFHPRRIVIVVVGAGHKFSAALGEPEGFTGMAARQNRAPVLYRDTERTGSTAGVHHQFVGDGRGEQVEG
jgi:hypothetical protein